MKKRYRKPQDSSLVLTLAIIMQKQIVSSSYRLVRQSNKVILLFTLAGGKEIIMELKDYQLEIIERALSLLESNYDSYDLEHLMYSGLELESEIRLIREKIDKKLVNS